MPNPERGRRRAGLTLLEVLAAVAVLGIFYTVLAAVNMQALRAEGIATRRLEASLLADRTLAELEAGVEMGTPLELGRTESEDDIFQVEVEVTAYDLAVPADPNPQGSDPPDTGTSFIASAGRGAASPLRRVDVRVRWIEGFEEELVARTTFAFDRESVRPELEALAREEEPGTGGDAPRDQESDTRDRPQPRTGGTAR